MKEIPLSQEQRMTHECCFCHFLWKDKRTGHMCETCPRCGTHQEVAYPPDPDAPDEPEPPQIIRCGTFHERKGGEPALLPTICGVRSTTNG